MYLCAGESLRVFYKWLSPLLETFERKQHDIFDLDSRQDGTWEWLQSTGKFNDWISGAERILWCPGQRMNSSRESALKLSYTD